MTPAGLPPASTSSALRSKLPFLDQPGAGPSPAAPQLEPEADQPVGGNAQQQRRWWLKLTAVVLILLPTVLTGLYYGLVAADQYTVEARFAVRGPSNKSGSDLLGIFSGSMSAGSTITDAYIVMDFIRSRELVDQLRPIVDIRKVFSRDEADIVARLDPASPVEEIVAYWRKMIEVGFDSGSQIITFKVRAFTPEDAKRLADAVIKQSEALINGLSERARKDAIGYALDEVAKSEQRLKKDRAALRDFRSSRQEIDPIKTAEAQVAQIARLDQELTATKAQIDTLRKYMKPDAPNVTFLTSKVNTLERQLAEERSRLGPGTKPSGMSSSASLSGAVGQYEELLVEREFAEKAYVSALASLERARIEAVQQNRYLATFVTPKLPEYALYPRRIVNTLIVLGASAILWALGVLIFYSIRDHAL